MHLYNIGGLKKFLRILVIQDAVLLAIAAIGVFVFWSFGAGMTSSYLQSSALVFLSAFCTAALLLGAWGIFVEITEGVWSIRAEARVRAWLIASLRAALVFSLLGLLWVVLETRAPAIPFSLAQTASTLALLAAIGLPLAASTLLTAGAFRHLVQTRRTSAALLQSVSSRDPSLARIEASVQSNAGATATTARPHPKGFFIAGLASKPWHESAEFPWAANFEREFPRILAEAKAALGETFDKLEHYHYPGIDTDRWKIYSFIADRREDADHLKACPATAAALREIPGYPFFRDAMFSILEPGGVIRPHRDHSNLFLTMHFGLQIPKDGFMEVAGMRRPWQAGRGLFFDSAYEHQAVNASGEPRVILLVDFLNPGITEAERRWIAEAPLWRE
ncbi:MAG: aspartyl/asparaginyl beta-hydroxylase domain-containing protein [Pseudomonadota bacterium]